MLKKLRNRFVRLSMVLIGAVLIVFFLFFFVLVLFSVTENIKTSLNGFASDSVGSVQHDIGEKDAYSAVANAIDVNSVCVVEVSGSGGIMVLDIGHGYMTEDILQEVVRYAQNSEYQFGHINSRRMFYSRVDTENGARIAFADSSQYFVYMKDLFIGGGILLIFIILILYIVNRWLSNIFLKPVEKAWEQQQNFIGDASHELKTPLTVILANTEIIQAHRQTTVEQQLKWVNSTGEEAAHMKELVDKMLMLAQAENNKKKVLFSEVDLSSLATKLTLQFEPIAYEAGVELISEIEKPITVPGEPTALNQMIHILVDNAIKYSPVGGTVTVRLFHRQNFVYLAVRNTGTPIPQEDIPHLFERFFRSDKARTAGKGYGLGLAICKTLAETHKAEISVTSNEENGTQFTVKFKVKNKIPVFFHSAP